MAKKVVNIVKNNKKDKDVNKKNNEIFNLNEEIIIGINNKRKTPDSSKVSNKKNTKKGKTKKSSNIKGNSKAAKKSKTVKKGYAKITDNKKSMPKKSNKTLKIVLLVILLFIAIVALLASPVFYVKEIIVKNSNNVSKEEIVNLSGIQLDKNIFKYINYNVMDKIKENSYIENVQISRKYPSTIIIDVEEREMTYYIKLGDSYIYIDNQGYIVDILEEDLNIPEIIGFKTEEVDFTKVNRLAEENLMKLEKIITIFDYAKTNEISDKIEKFIIDNNRILIELQDNKIVYIENFNNLNIKMLSLKTIIERTEGKAGEIFLDGQGQSQSIVFKEKI